MFMTILLFLLALPQPALGQQPSEEELAKQTQNPVADLIGVPLGGGIGKLFRLGDVLPLEGHPIAKLPVNIQLQAFGNVVRPEFGPKWQLRFQIQFLFPK